MQKSNFMPNNPIVSLFFVLSLVPASVFAEDLSNGFEGITRVATVEGITEYRLDNGLKFILFPDQSNQQITVNITYLVGSLHEGYGETGMAHLLEHLVFKGTPDHSNISAEFTERGVFANGTTWYDRTNYYETFPANDENLEWAMDLEADRMVNSYIAKKDLDSEMTVVRNEWEAGENNPFSVLFERVYSTAYLWHNYGKSTIGARADIENVPIERLQAFYRKYYQPDNAFLVIAGRFDETVALELVQEKFGAIPRPDRTGYNKLYDLYTAEPAQDGEKTVTLQRVGDLQLAVVAYHIPAGSHPQFAAISVLGHVLGNQPSGRLYESLVKPGLASNIFAGSDQLKQPGLFLTGVEVRENKPLDDATEVLFNTLDELINDSPPTDEEVERAKAEFRSQFENMFKSPQTIGLQMSEWAAMGDWRLMFLHRDNVGQVTAEDVHKVAKSYLLRSNRTIGSFYPVESTPPRAEIPETPDVDALVRDYVGGEAIASGEAFDPTIGNIKNRTTYVILGDGMKVAMLPKQTRGDSVNISFALPFGTEDALMHMAHEAQLAASMLMRGTVNRSRQEIQDELNRLKSSISIGGGTRLLSGSVTTDRENLAPVLGLLREVLREPAFDSTEFDLLKESQIALNETRKSDPQYLASQASQRYLVQMVEEGHPFYYYTAEENIEHLQAASVEDSKEFSEQFFGASNGTLAAVGDFDPDELRILLSNVFDGWVSPQIYEHIPYQYVRQDPVNEKIETPDKTNATMVAVLNLPIYEEHVDFPAFVIGIDILGGGFLSSRLAERIRQQDGLSYGVWSYVNYLSPDPTSLFGAGAIFAPENRDRVVAAFNEEVARVLDDGYTDSEVDAAITGYLDTRQNARSSDASVAQTLAANMRWGRDLDFVSNFESAIEDLTTEQINEAVRRHLEQGQIAIFTAGDFARVKQEASGSEAEIETTNIEIP